MIFVYIHKHVCLVFGGWACAEETGVMRAGYTAWVRMKMIWRRREVEKSYSPPADTNTSKMLSGGTKLPQLVLMLTNEMLIISDNQAIRSAFPTAALKLKG